MVGRVEVLFVAGNKVGQRRPWYVLGKLVSPTCALALLGMGLDRYNRIMQHRRDMRKSDEMDIWHSLVRHSGIQVKLITLSPRTFLHSHPY